MAAKPMAAVSSTEGVRRRVNLCMTKLSDRDTEAMAANELDSIARSLSPDTLPPFLSAISDARPTDKTPLRRHSLRLLSLVSTSHPPSTLAPLLPRMLSSALRRLRDPDSSVRTACVDAVSSISAATPPNSFPSAILRPLADALLHEQESHAQLSAALCLSAAVQSASAAKSASSDLALHLQKLIPKLVKLLKSNAFKAKPALISLLGSVVAAGGAANPAMVGLLMPCLVDAIAWEDWSARKAASETLSILAVSQRDLLVGFKSSCISTFESRRFDKVKIVRESMNRMLDLWKEIPDELDSDLNTTTAKSQSKSSIRDITSDGRYPPAPLSSSNSVQSNSPIVPRKNRYNSSRSPPPEASPINTERKITIRSSIRNKKLSPPLSRKLDNISNNNNNNNNNNKGSECRIEIAVSKTPIKVVGEERFYEEKGSNKMTGFKSGSRVVPFHENGGLNGIIEGGESKIEQKESGDLSLIRMQLVQIENQQSSLLDLLQRFMGSSQNGIHSLENRVHGLEMALDEISRDLAVTSGRISNSLTNNNEPEPNTCCRLPGAEFLSPKYWRRNEGRYSSRFSVSDIQKLSEESRASYKWDRQRFGQQNGGIVVNPLADINSQSQSNRGSAEVVGSCRMGEDGSLQKMRAG